MAHQTLFSPVFYRNKAQPKDPQRGHYTSTLRTLQMQLQHGGVHRRGAAALVKQSWCTVIKVLAKLSSRPFYLSRELQSIISHIPRSLKLNWSRSRLWKRGQTMHWLNCRTALRRLTWRCLGRPQTTSTNILRLLAVTSAGVHPWVALMTIQVFSNQKPCFD